MICTYFVDRGLLDSFDVFVEVGEKGLILDAAEFLILA